MKKILGLVMLVGILMSFKSSEGYPCHPNGDIGPCTHRYHSLGDQGACGHFDYYGNRLHVYDIYPCAHIVHSVGDVYPCTHICY